jgi:fucose permease
MKRRHIHSRTPVADRAADGHVVMHMWTLPRRPPPNAGAPSHQVRRARAGVTLTFALAGGLVGAFTARIPALLDKLSISAFQLGIVLFVWGLGAILAMQALRFVMARVGSAPVLRAATPLCAVSVAMVASAPSYPLLLVEVGLFGVAFGAVDVAANAQGSIVERAYGRPLMNSMHAGWPVGAGLGGLSAAACAQAGISYLWCLGGAAAIALPSALVLGRAMLDSPPVVTDTRGATRGRIRPIVYLLGLLSFAAYVLEGAVTDWTGVLIHETLGGSQAIAALAYPMFQGGMLLGRLGADRVLVRSSARTLVICAGVATVAGLVAVTATTHLIVALAGVFCVGVSISPLVPVAASLAAAADPVRSEAAIAQLGVLGFAGLLAGPAMIGTFAEITTLRVAIGAVAVLLGSVIVMAGQLLPAGPRAKDAGPASGQEAGCWRPPVLGIPAATTQS